MFTNVADTVGQSRERRGRRAAYYKPVAVAVGGDNLAAASSPSSFVGCLAGWEGGALGSRLQHAFATRVAWLSFF